MDINQLIEIIEKKILSHDCISKVKIEDKSFYTKITKIMCKENFIFYYQ